MKYIFCLKRTFTLIEMLIVIVIIGILAAALVPRLQSVQSRSRDAKRKIDVKSIYNANEIYKLDMGLYAKPQNSFRTTWDYDIDIQLFSFQSQPWISGLATYMTSIPTDPLNTTGMNTSQWSPPWYTGNYVYMYGRVLNGWLTYDLTTQLENKQDPDRCEVKQYKYYYTITGYSIPWCNWTMVWLYPVSPWIYEYSPDSNSF